MDANLKEWGGERMGSLLMCPDGGWGTKSNGWQKGGKVARLVKREEKNRERQ